MFSRPVVGLPGWEGGPQNTFNHYERYELGSKIHYEHYELVLGTTVRGPPTGLGRGPQNTL